MPCPINIVLDQYRQVNIENILVKRMGTVNGVNQLISLFYIAFFIKEFYCLLDVDAFNLRQRIRGLHLRQFGFLFPRFSLVIANAQLNLKRFQQVSFLKIDKAVSQGTLQSILIFSGLSFLFCRDASQTHISFRIEMFFADNIAATRTSVTTIIR